MHHCPRSPFRSPYSGRFACKTTMSKPYGSSCASWKGGNEPRRFLTYSHTNEQWARLEADLLELAVAGEAIIGESTDYGQKTRRADTGESFAGSIRALSAFGNSTDSPPMVLSTIALYHASPTIRNRPMSLNAPPFCGGLLDTPLHPLVDIFAVTDAQNQDCLLLQFQDNSVVADPQLTVPFQRPLQRL